MTNPVSRIRNKLKQVLSPLRGGAPAGRFRSGFGGLWTDSPHALAILERKVAKGSISLRQAEQLKCWIDDGYVVLPEAVDTSTVDAMLADVESIYSGTLGECFVETWESGRMEVIPVTPRHKNGQHKLLDIYSVSRVARQAQFSPAIADFLQLVFERPALAFQSLYFQFGSEQALHQDSAFVRVSSPMELAASWIALEDIKEGSGELEYVPGSHCIDEYLFQGKSKWMPDNSPEYQSFISHIALQCEKRRLARQKFLPKKGDAFIWSADLAHGGSTISAKGTTRRSLVTHYCPADITPWYFRYNHSGKIEAGNAHYIAFHKRT